MSDWTYESELEKAQRNAEEFSQKAKKALEDGDQALAEQLLLTADTWQTLTRAWQTIIKNQTFNSPPPNFDLEGLRALQGETSELAEKARLAREKSDQLQAELAEKIRKFKERSEESQKKWEEADARYAEEKAKYEEERDKFWKRMDGDEPPQEPNPA